MRGGSLNRRLRAIEAVQTRSGQRHVHDMTDDELHRILNVRDPATKQLRMDLSPDELNEITRDERSTGARPQGAG